MTTVTPEALYYDPYDLEIDKDPHPVWKRFRDEAPLWYNERLDFWMISRFEDVERAMKDWDTYRSGQGSTLDIIKADIELPPGIILMEDPPVHDVHRGLLSRVFTPRKMNALEDQVRAFCAQSLDPLVGSDRFDFVADLGAEMPMRTIGMLLGIPEEDQAAIRDGMDEGLSLDEHGRPRRRSQAVFDGDQNADDNPNSDALVHAVVPSRSGPPATQLIPGRATAPGRSSGPAGPLPP